MRLQDLIHRFEVVASRQPAVNMLVRNDVFRINQSPVNKYGIFAWTQGVHSGDINNGMMTYNFTFFYVDRMTDDRENQVEIQSVGLQVLSNVLRRMNDDGIAVNENVTFQPFNQRFTDLCAGVYVNASFVVPADSVCGEIYAHEPDYNEDFNEDFLIY